MNDGSSPLTKYIVSVLGTSFTKDVSANLTTTSFEGLATDTPYNFMVKATNLIGNSQPAISNEVSYSINVPSAPRNVNATLVPGLNQANVTWTFPLSDGNSSITGYLITTIFDGITFTTTTVSSGTFFYTTPLQYLVLTQFRIQAINIIGLSAISNTESIVGDRSFPSPPVNVQTILSGTTATVTWSAPFDGDSPITGYIVSDGYSTTTTVSSSTFVYIQTNLTYFIEYNFRVIAVNAIGNSSPTLSNTVIPEPVMPESL
jgi:hypothetical protein